MADHLTQPTTPATVARVRAWIANAKQPNRHIAELAGVDEKTIRLAKTKPNWNPTADTLAKLEAIIPAPKKRARAAA
jgi:hypothetical protein